MTVYHFARTRATGTEQSHGRGPAVSEIVTNMQGLRPRLDLSAPSSVRSHFDQLFDVAVTLAVSLSMPGVPYSGGSALSLDDATTIRDQMVEAMRSDLRILEAQPSA